jgi:REP element-mobilizing transposase RayT
MPSTYTQLYVHLIFAVMFKNSQIQPRWRDSLFLYLNAIIKNHHQELLEINGSTDHIHLLLKIKTDLNLSALVRDLKSYSTKWVNISNYNEERFRWQTGFGAFSVGHGSLKKTKEYIQNEGIRHNRERFLEEYKRLLKAHEVPYQAAYIFRELV